VQIKLKRLHKPKRKNTTHQISSHGVQTDHVQISSFGIQPDHVPFSSLGVQNDHMPISSHREQTEQTEDEVVVENSILSKEQVNQLNNHLKEHSMRDVSSTSTQPSIKLNTNDDPGSKTRETTESTNKFSSAFETFVTSKDTVSAAIWYTM
jgi:hypothetical protein